jgi:hypothetical protein|tara:strand:- start:49 stop:321 length:273 start_codon:yes stop_codon:yes gene_type:complete
MALTITVSINDTDEKLLKNDLNDTDMWIQDAVTGKINNCWKRFKNQWTTKLMDDPTFTDPIESDKDKFVAQVLAHPDYKDRATQDAEAQA